MTTHQALKNRIKVSILFPVLITITFSSFSQEYLKKFSFPETKKSITVPFKLINNLIIIPVRINGSDTLQFIFDTGINSIILTEVDLWDKLSLKYAREIDLTGLGKGESVKAIHSYDNKIEINGIKGIQQDVFVLKQNLFNLSSQLAIPIHGLIGGRLLKDFIIEINYFRKQITFFKPEQYIAKKKHREVVCPLMFTNTKPYINITLYNESGNRTIVKLLVDTGAGHALWIDIFSNSQIHIPEKNISTYLGYGLSGKIHGYIGRIPKLKISDYYFSNIITAFPDSLSIAPAIGLDKRNGSIGGELLRRFYLVFNYHDSTLSISPNPYFGQPFKYNMSGIEVGAIVPGIPYYKINYIAPGSPADYAGLKPDDELLKINGTSASKYSIQEINDLLQKRPGKRIKLKIRRKELEFMKSFLLKETI